MKTLLQIAAFSALFAFPVHAYAQTATPPMKMGEMSYPMSQEMGAMQKEMSDMTKEISSLAENTRDPARKKQMLDIHGRMEAMVVRMSKMNDGMDIMARNKDNPTAK
ncbi:MAG: hypothetical protein JWO78_1754 [Micavibrio sp.]|nr:hypothetical protein [Micavibrio sp.]